MMIVDALKLDIDPIKTEMNGTKQILISHVFFTDERESKQLLAEKTLLQVCSTDEAKSESVIVDESYTEESELKSVHKNINREKDTKNET